jgi:branched-chain amino acid transport system permease protein
VYTDPPPDAVPMERWLAWLALTAAALTLFVLANLLHSRVGRNLRAVRDDEIAAQLAGIHVARTQVLAFVLSAACAGLGGAMFAVLAQSVSPSTFSLILSLFLLLAVVVGGLGSLAGAALGALLLVLLPDALATLTAGLPVGPDLAQRLAGNLPLAVFGLTLVVVVLMVPGGLAGALGRASGGLAGPLLRLLRRPHRERSRA